MGEKLYLIGKFPLRAAKDDPRPDLYDHWYGILDAHLSEMSGRITGDEAWKLIDPTGRRRTWMENARLGYALRAVGFERTTLRVGGRLCKCYVKAKLHQRPMPRDILVFRDPVTGVITAGYRAPEGE